MTDDYDIVWNGTLDKQLACPALSTYIGPSPLGPATSGIYKDQLAWGECMSEERRQRNDRDKARQILRHLKAGWGYGRIARQVKVGHAKVKAVAELHGYDRVSREARAQSV